MVVAEVRPLDLFANIPAGLPVGETQTDPALAAHNSLNSIVERGQIESFLRTERMPDRPQPFSVHFRQRLQHVERPLAVVEHLSHSRPTRMASLELIDAAL